MTKNMEQKQAESTQSVSLIAKDISYIQKDISNINQSIKELAGIYATKTFVDDGNKMVESRLTNLEASSNLWRWLSPSLAAVLGSVLTFLIVNYIGNLGRIQ